MVETAELSVLDALWSLQGLRIKKRQREGKRGRGGDRDLRQKAREREMGMGEAKK